MREITKNYLNKLYKNELLDSSNKPVLMDLTTRISEEQGNLLYQIANQSNVKKTLEIGFAYGFSTIFILEGLMGRDNTCHVAIDPFQKGHWSSIGLNTIKSLGYKNFEWIEDFSIHALSHLIKSHQTFDFIFIDGNHRFDDILVDFYMSDQILNVGGFLVLDDMWMKSTKLVDKFISTNRSYAKVNQPVMNASVFVKTSNDTRNWDHFIDFE